MHICSTHPLLSPLPPHPPHPPPPYNENKVTQLFPVIPPIAPHILLFFILHYSSVFDYKFTWKSYANFSYIKSYLAIHEVTFVEKRRQEIWFY